MRFLLLVLLAGSVHAETLTGRVIGIADGDTITVLDANRQQHKIRLQGIDAPEKAQPFGERSKQSLSQMVFGKDVRVEWDKRDRYDRIVGKVWVQPADCPRCGLTLDARPRADHGRFGMVVSQVCERTVTRRPRGL